eukprot:CAMPEP_0201231900 /NCGR_PEP_ID=MMETSP0852-20130820/3768_2 /ASSEMBLY_ACC=CAM_ASM_000632 /TAXON_ID=183588 /ORGANISM="Pseudo-nitzschia fraudulenta, Strain WWA7" /LENGTH=104 /DNA_ID=CAMNT_0047524019 /DNA_START=541 /DNA_END=855 /DNA_ORIENTATION=-
MVVALIAEKEAMFPPAASPKDSTPFEARVVRKREIPTITSAIPDQKEWYCSYVKPNCSDPGEGTCHKPPHDPFGGTNDVKVSSNAKCAIPAAMNAEDKTHGKIV